MEDSRHDKRQLGASSGPRPSCEEVGLAVGRGVEETRMQLDMIQAGRM